MPGTQTVTVVVSMLRVELGVAATLTGCTLGVLDGGTLVLLVFGAGVAAGLTAVGAAVALGRADCPRRCRRHRPRRRRRRRA
ncbi:hypothetical protein [Paraburkholderia tropica]|uniref:hypothetical protein n=1 Tax=Paraburkholderia tropica TaxID=92647 RepID=UPI0030846E30